MSIPGWKIPTDLDVRTHTLRIEAESVSGFGNLEFDTIILVPAEHQIYISTTVTVLNTSIPGPDYALDVFTFPSGQLTAVVHGEGVSYPYPAESTLPSQISWGLPRGIGRIVVVSAGATNTLTTEEINLDLNVYERYAVLRGAQ
jgi:hypothetical protein